jgi:hypothetical protein
MIIGVARDVGHSNRLEALERAAPVSTPTTRRMPVFGAHFLPSSNEMRRCVRLKTIMT